MSDLSVFFTNDRRPAYRGPDPQPIDWSKVQEKRNETVAHITALAVQAEAISKATGNPCQCFTVGAGDAKGTATFHCPVHRT